LKEKLLGNIRSLIQEFTDLIKLCYISSVHGATIMLEIAKEKADPEFTVADKKTLAAALKQQWQAEGGDRITGTPQSLKPSSMLAGEADTASSWGWHGMPSPFHSFTNGNTGWGLRPGDRYNTFAVEELDEDE
jgi:hypothetical protein